MDDLMKSNIALQEFIEKQFGLKCNLPYEKNPDEVQQLRDIITDIEERHIIPETYPIEVSACSDLDLFKYRNRLIKAGSFSLVSYDWVRKLKETIIKDSKCLEIMAGSGMLAKALKDVGCDVIATDNKSWKFINRDEREDRTWFDNPFTDVEELDCIDAIEKYGKDVDFVIVSWAYMDDTCYRALLKMREVNPECLMIYIGEYGDCCADENFTQAAESFDLSWFEYKTEGKKRIQY